MKESQCIWNINIMLYEVYKMKAQKQLYDEHAHLVFIKNGCDARIWLIKFDSAEKEIKPHRHSHFN